LAPGAVQPGDAVGRAKTPANGTKNGESAALIVVDSQAARPSDSHDAADPVIDSNVGYDDDERNVTITLRGAEFERLRVASERSGVQVEDIVKDLLRSTLKYL
jgi:hypothetical protein